MLVAIHPADFRRDKTKNFSLQAGDTVEIVDKHARPKGVQINVHRKDELEPIGLFIPLKSWQKICPKNWPYSKVNFDEIFDYDSKQARLVHTARSPKE